MVTRTINQLHFEDLDPIRFEELVLSIVYRMRRWDKLDHFGKKGSDDGIDISAVEILKNGGSNTYHFQCKRYQKMTNSIIRNIIDDYLIKNNEVPNVYILIVSCALTKKQIDYFELYCSNHGFKTVTIWTNSIIEAMLYAEYPDLLFIYFGINLFAENFQMKSNRYECLKNYLDNLNVDMDSFEYNGELTQTFGCMRDIFNLSLDKFLYIKNKHKDNDYLFEPENNRSIYYQIDSIDNMISEYVDKYRDTDIDKQQEIAEQMDKISLQIYYFVNKYVEMIKKQISDILFCR